MLNSSEDLIVLHFLNQLGRITENKIYMNN